MIFCNLFARMKEPHHCSPLLLVEGQIPHGAGIWIPPHWPGRVSARLRAEVDGCEISVLDPWLGTCASRGQGVGALPCGMRRLCKQALIIWLSTRVLALQGWLQFLPCWWIAVFCLCVGKDGNKTQGANWKKNCREAISLFLLHIFDWWGSISWRLSRHLSWWQLCWPFPVLIF